MQHNFNTSSRVPTGEGISGISWNFNKGCSRQGRSGILLIVYNSQNLMCISKSPSCFSVLFVLCNILDCVMSNVILYLTCLAVCLSCQISHLGLVGGSNPGDAVRRVMRALATNRVWSSYSLRGKRGKLSLIGTTLCKIIKRECIIKPLVLPSMKNINTVAINEIMTSV